MKRHRQRHSRTNQLRRPLNINTPIVAQQPKHNAIHSHRSSNLNRALHLLKLRRRIKKIPAARPHHRKNWQTHTSAHLSHQLHTRRHSSNIERPTQLNPRSPASLRRDRPLQTLHRNLYQDLSAHQLTNDRLKSFFPNFQFPFSNAIFSPFSRIPKPLLVIVFPSRKPR